MKSAFIKWISCYFFYFLLLSQLCLRISFFKFINYTLTKKNVLLSKETHISQIFQLHEHYNRNCSHELISKFTTKDFFYYIKHRASFAIIYKVVLNKININLEAIMLDSLGYKLIVDKVIRRKINLLNTLQLHPKPVSEIAQQFQVSVKTILSTVRELQYELPPDVSLEIIDSSVLYLKIHNFFAFSHYIKSLLNNNPLFQVIESIFQGDKKNIDDYAEDLFISEKTLRNYLSTLEQLLDTYQLSITKKPLDIVGNEANIRFFYFNYFRYAHEQPLSKTTKNNAIATYNILDSLGKKYGTVLHVDYYRLLNWLQILERRLSKNNFIILDKKIIEKYSNTESFHIFRQGITHYFEHNPILKNIPQSEFIYAFIVRLGSIVYEDNTIFFMADYIEYTTQFELIASQFLKELKVHPTLHASLRIKIQCFLTNLTFLTDITPLFQKSNPELHNQVSKRYELILNTWKSLLNQYNQWLFPEDIAVNLSLITATHLKLNEYSNKKVLIALSGEPAALNYFTAIAKKSLPKKMDCFFIFNKPITDDFLKMLSIDICIYNFNPIEKLTASTLIRLSDTPSEDEWHSLWDRLYTF